MPSRTRTEGFSSNASVNYGPTASEILNGDEIARLIGKKMGRLSANFSANAEFYLNERIRKGRIAQPEYILSPVGLTDHPQKFGWSWLPPARGTYTVWPQGQIRPWAFIMLHSYGYAWDLYYLRRNRRRQFCPGDENGYNPSRWFAGIRQLCALNTDLTKKKQGHASIHFCISRRGDVVVSADLNDLAWHGAGTVKIHPRGNNYFTVGIELEPALGRFKYANGRLSEPQVLPYPDRQILALAIVCKKLVTYRGGISENYITKQKGSVRVQAEQYGSGYITHMDVNTNKLDPRGQFSILPGEVGTDNPNPFLKGLKSGWDQLWEQMRTLKYTLATDVFVKDVAEDIFADMVDISVAMVRTTNAGQRASIQQQRDRLLALQRAVRMQAKTRHELYKQGASQATTAIDIIAKTTAAVSKQVQRFDVSGVKGVQGDVQSFDFSTGTWFVGGVDTGNPV